MEETSPSDDVAERDKVMCESENVSIQVRITWRMRTMVPSVKVTKGDECGRASETSRVHVQKQDR